MRNILVLVLLGLALAQLSCAEEQEQEKQVSLLETEGDLQIKQLADTGRKKHKGNKKNKKGRNAKKGGLKKKKKGGKFRKGKGKKGTNGKKIRNRSQNKRRKARKNKMKTKGKQNKCVAGCSDLVIEMMKAARKQNTYLKQFNRIIRGQATSQKKGLKKDNFKSNATDGPLNLLITAGGGNASELTCAGSKTNKAALLMANLTAKLIGCEADLTSKCNTSAFTKIKPEWSACNASMVAFKTASDKCVGMSGNAACSCFNDTAVSDLLKKVENCSGTEMAAASVADGKLKKACVKVYGACRQGGEGIRPVLAACQPGGATEDELKAQVGVVLKNTAANDKIKAKTTTLVSSAGRKVSKRASATFGGTTYTLDTCSDWATGATAWVTAVSKKLEEDISSAGETIAAITPTCTSSDLAALQTLEKKATEVSKKLEKKATMLQKNLEKATGTTVSPTAAAAAADTAAAAASGTAATKSVRRRSKILAEFRQRL